MESLKVDLAPPSKPGAAGDASDAGLAQALQGLELMGEGLNGAPGASEQGHTVPSLPPGFDVWSADVPPAYAGLATAAYNPMGLASQGDPSARYLLRNPPAAAPGGLASSSGALGGSDGRGPASGGSAVSERPDSVASSGQSRSRSRFQFAQEDSKEGVSDPLWCALPCETLCVNVHRAAERCWESPTGVLASQEAPCWRESTG